MMMFTKMFYIRPNFVKTNKSCYFQREECFTDLKINKVKMKMLMKQLNYKKDETINVIYFNLIGILLV